MGLAKQKVFQVRHDEGYQISRISLISPSLGDVCCLGKRGRKAKAVDYVQAYGMI